MKTLFTFLLCLSTVAVTFAQSQDIATTAAAKVVNNLNEMTTLTEEQTDKIYAIAAEHFEGITIEQDDTKIEIAEKTAEAMKGMKKEVYSTVLSKEQQVVVEAAKEQRKSASDE